MELNSCETLSSDAESSQRDHIHELSVELDGRPLAPPKLKFGYGEQYNAEALTSKIPWPLKFVQSKDPAAQREGTHVEELDLPPGSSDISSSSRLGQSFARVVHGVLQPNECAELLAWANEMGFARLGSRQRCVVDCRDLAHYLFEVLRPHLPETLCYNRESVEELNERCRIVCYAPGQELEAHRDTTYQRPKGHPKAGQASRLTVQLYLHDVPEANGGATSFIGKDSQVNFQPRGGSVLIFTHDLLHEGSKLAVGLKYILRTEAMYKQKDSEEYLQWIAAI